MLQENNTHLYKYRNKIIYFFTILLLLLILLINSNPLINKTTFSLGAQIINPTRSNLLLLSNRTKLVNNHLFLPLVVKGAPLPTFYVSTNGNDSNPGSYDLPWRTIGKAARMVFPGVLVYIRGGVYSEVVEVRISGTESQPIRFVSYPGENPIIDGYNQIPTYWVGLFSMLGDWIQVSGIETRNSKYDGFGLYGNHDMANNVFAHHHQYHGVLITGDYGEVVNSRFWYNSLMNEYGVSGNGSSALYASRDTDNEIADYIVMRNNVVWENWGEGISTAHGNNVVIDNNLSHDNFSTNIYVSDSTNILVRGNFTYMNPSSNVYSYGSNVGIMLGDETYNPPSANITIINNIAYGNNRNLYWWRGVQGGGMSNVLIANNTFVNSTGTSGVIIMQGSHQNVRFTNNLTQQDGSLPIIIVESNPELLFSNNLWSKAPPPAASGLGDVIGDPNLTNDGSPYSPEWFLLTILSPAIDRAIALPEIITDYFGNIRGAFPDMSAIEYIPAP